MKSIFGTSCIRLLSVLCLSVFVAASAIAYEPISHYVVQDIEGWHVYVHRDLLPGGKHEKDGTLALRQLKYGLAKTNQMVAKPALAKLHAVNIWLEVDSTNGKHGRTSAYQYHPGAGWLKKMDFHPKKVKCVEYGRASSLARRSDLKTVEVTMHELAHAYHDQVLDFNNADILAAHKRAREDGKYPKRDWVVRANHKEFFAGLCTRYFESEERRKEIVERDPVFAKKLEEYWGKPKALFESPLKKSDPPKQKTQIVVPNVQALAAKTQLLSKIEQTAEEGKRPPNVVLILADDLGYADIGAYGSKTIPTPHIDALAAEGVRFTDAYVTAATCSPSRAGLISGRYQQRFGFEFNTAGGAITYRESRGLDPAVVTMADVFQKAGYATGMFGKWHLGSRDHFHPQERGFDEFFGFLAGAHSFFPAKRKEPFYSTIMRDRKPLSEPAYLTDAFAREAVKFITNHKNKPFYLYVPFNAVHTPIEATKKYLNRFPNETDRKQRAYNAMTSALDDAVGSIVKAVKDNGIDKNTLVVFVNDNGGPTYTKVQSNGPLRLGKLFLFEGGIRVPMIFRWPGVLEPGKTYSKPVSSLDIFPTVCAAAKIRLPKELKLDGLDLLPYLRNEKTATPHDMLFWSNGPNKAVRMGDWKLIIAGEHRFLFNLRDDVGEKKNVANQEPKVLKQLEDALHGWQDQMKPPAWPSKPERREVEIDGVPYEINI